MILEKIIDMLKEQEVLDNTEITEDTTFEELDLDSLSIVDLTMSCEDEFDVQIPDEKLSVMQPQGYTVIAMPRRIDDRSVQTNRLEYLRTLVARHYSDLLIIDRNKTRFLIPNKEAIRRMNIILLNIRHDYHRPVVRYLLRDPHVIRMKMRYKYVGNILQLLPSLTKRPAEFIKRSCPACVEKYRTVTSFY